MRRRDSFKAIFVAAVVVPQAAFAFDDSSSSIGARAAELRAIEQRSGTVEVAWKLAALIPLDPSRGRGATSPALDGSWRLIWSVKAEAFSPLLRLPPPLRPESYQLLGRAADVEVGEGRVAPMLTSGVLGVNKLWLSSGVN